MKAKRNARRQQGFTMVEMLVVVTIMGILMAVAFVAVISYQRSMKQFELNKTAQEIFIAAQNHLTMADAQGALEQKASKGWQPSSPENAETNDIYYWFVAPQDVQLTTGRNSVLYEMLPQHSIDDTVRLGGSYVIKYDLKTATVLEVFYSDQSNLSTHVFQSSDYSALVPEYESDTDDAQNRRLDFQGAILGYYDGSDLDRGSVSDLFKPEIKVINAERLEVQLSFTLAALTSNQKVAGSAVQLIVQGDTSGNSRPIGDTIPLASFSGEGGTALTVTRVLDDITIDGMHFADQFCKGADPLIPGENLTIYAQVYSNSKLSTIVRSAQRHTNSLFRTAYNRKEVLSGAEAVAAGSTTKITRYATITNIRHLENMDESISGYDLAALGEDGATSFQQTANLQWSGPATKASRAFTNKIAGEDGDPAKVQVHYLDKTTTAEGSYAPVNTGYEFSYDGNGLSVSQVNVSNAAEAGLFGTVRSSSVQDLHLVDFNVNTTNGNAGALAGTLNGATVQGVYAHNTVPDSGSKEITASGNAGGLAGKTVGGNISESAAAVYVRATGTESASAGGLVGLAEGTPLTKCYAGGHTVDGMYLTDAPTAENAATPGRLNVQGQAEAGGLVGKVTGTTSITYCYATASAYGAVVGGLVGSASAGSIESCYATGFVAGNGDDASLGAFVGEATGTSFANDWYLTVPNDGRDPAVEPLSTGTADGVSAADEDLASFRSFYSGRFVSADAADQAKQGAEPYDATLTRNYDGHYPFKSVGELEAFTTGNAYTATSIHYGDWASPETLVVNARTQP